MSVGKCSVCGYEFDYKWEQHERKIIKGDEPFIEIYCTNDIRFETDKTDPWNLERKKAYLYGCPKCNSVHFWIDK